MHDDRFALSVVVWGIILAVSFLGETLYEWLWVPYNMACLWVLTEWYMLCLNADNPGTMIFIFVFGVFFWVMGAYIWLIAGAYAVTLITMVAMLL